MKQFIIYLGLVNVLLFSQVSLAEPVVVVVNKNNPIEALSKSQVIDIYMGKYVAFPNGESASPVDGPNDVKGLFYLNLIHRSLSQVNAYWSRIRFTGRASPPFPKATNQEVLEHIKTNRNGIGYLPKSAVTDEVKVIYEVAK